MSDMYDAQGSSAPFDMDQARNRFGPKIVSKRKKVTGQPRAIRRKPDGRSLRATGRTEHLNFRAKPVVKSALHDHVGHGRQSVWLEEAIVAKLRAEGIEI